LGLNVGLCGKKLESTQLSDVMDVDLSGINVMGIGINLVSQYCNELPVITLPSLTLRSLTLYIYGAPILDVSRSHTTTQHSR